MSTKSTDVEYVLGRLETILKEVWDERPADLVVDFDASFPDLGIDSLTLVLVLDKAGTEFHIDWDAESSSHTAGSLRSVAELVVRRNSGGAVGAGGGQCARTART